MKVGAPVQCLTALSQEADGETVHNAFFDRGFAPWRSSTAPILDLDVSGDICGITVEHARFRAELPQCSFEQVGACSRLTVRGRGP